MSVSSDSPLIKQIQSIRESVKTLTTEARYSEIWGTDLNDGEPMIVEIIIRKFIQHHPIIPSLQVPKARYSLLKTLEWRRRTNPPAGIDKAKSILSELGLLCITKNRGSYVLNLGVAVVELLATLLLSQPTPIDQKTNQAASCVLEFRLQQKPRGRKGYVSFRGKVQQALGDLIRLIYSHYPGLLDKTYIVYPSLEYLASLDVPDYLLRNTTLLEKPEDLALYLGPDIPPKYGGDGRSLSKLNCAEPLWLDVEGQENRQSTPEAEGKSDRSTGEKEMAGGQAPNVLEATDIQRSTASPEEPQPRLLYSEDIGPPTIILDPEDLKDAEDLIPNKMGARLAWADTDMLAKFGHGARLAEAEALHLVSKRTTIAVPKLLSAYILDGTGYIIMSYEHGTPFGQYWDNASETEHQRILAQLTDYVQQMRAIEGNFIGGLDHSPCRDGVFEGGYGDYSKYSYGPYESEQSFNEGMAQALRDRLPAELLESENNPESSFWTSEYILHQTVRGLTGHKIVFTHGDLHEGNMLVRSDGTVVLLDCGLSGFWPEYWEFYRAMFNPPWRTSRDRMVERFIPPYYVEYDVMKEDLRNYLVLKGLCEGIPSYNVFW